MVTLYRVSPPHQLPSPTWPKSTDLQATLRYGRGAGFIQTRKNTHHLFSNFPSTTYTDRAVFHPQARLKHTNHSQLANKHFTNAPIYYIVCYNFQPQTMNWTFQNI